MILHAEVVETNEANAASRISAQHHFSVYLKTSVFSGLIHELKMPEKIIYIHIYICVCINFTYVYILNKSGGNYLVDSHGRY